MAKIYRYQKQSDAYTNYRAQGEDVVELCTLDDGYTYISGPDVMPTQLPQVKIEEATLSDEIRQSIKSTSPQCRLIYDRMQAKIREKYCSEDEMYLTRISVGNLMGTYVMESGEADMVQEYQTFIEGVREWGRSERAKYGL